MKYKIADIIVDLDVQYPHLKKQIAPYEYDEAANVNVEIRLTEALYQAYLETYPDIEREMIEYIALGNEYYTALIHFNGMLIHSSCVVYDGRAYLFSAPCGTGKSTHTQLWLKRFPDAYILNDDKPAIRICSDGIFAYGTPFSGKTDLNVNERVPIGGICMVERSETNSIERISDEEALFGILDQTVRPQEEEIMDKLLRVIDKIVRNVPVYRLKCNMELEAAEVAYNGMKGVN